MLVPLLELCPNCLGRMHALNAPQNDFTPEEEEEVRRENQWAFD